MSHMHAPSMDPFTFPMEFAVQATAEEVTEAFFAEHEQTPEAWCVNEMYEYLAGTDEAPGVNLDADVAPRNANVGDGNFDCMRLGLWRKLEVASHQPPSCREVPYVRFDYQRNLYIASIMGVRHIVKRNRQRGPQMVVTGIFKSHELGHAIAARDEGLRALGVELHMRKGERGVWWTLCKLVV